MTWTLLTAVLARQTWVLEAFLAAQAVSWGLWVVWPWTDAFQAVQGVYTVLEFVPETLVGGVYLAHGLAHAYAIYRKNVRWTTRAALAATLLWLVVLTDFVITAPSSPAVAVYTCSVVASAWVYVRLRWRFG